MAECTVRSRDSSGGSLRGIDGGVERILNVFRQKSECLSISKLVKQSIEEEKGDSDCGRRGKVVLYTTSVRAVRGTHERCKQVSHTLRAHHILFTNKDVFLHPDYSRELAERMGDDPKDISLPQLFVAGEHVGDGEMVMEMNETGELQNLLKEYKQVDTCGSEECTCCGGQGFVLCSWCQGSKKGIKNAFNDLKCTVCNPNGLQICPECSD